MLSEYLSYQIWCMENKHLCIIQSFWFDVPHNAKWET